MFCDSVTIHFLSRQHERTDTLRELQLTLGFTATNHNCATEFTLKMVVSLIHFRYIALHVQHRRAFAVAVVILRQAVFVHKAILFLELVFLSFLIYTQFGFLFLVNRLTQRNVRKSIKFIIKLISCYTQYWDDIIPSRDGKSSNHWFFSRYVHRMRCGEKKKTRYEEDKVWVFPAIAHNNFSCAHSIYDWFTEGSWIAISQSPARGIWIWTTVPRIACAVKGPKTRWPSIRIFIRKFCSAKKLTFLYVNKKL